MTISTRLRFSSIAVAFLITLFVGVTFFLALSLQRSHQKQQFAQHIAESSFQMTVLQGEYFLHPEERSKSQWMSIYGVLSRTLDEASPVFSEIEEGELLEEIHIIAGDSLNLFSQLVGNIEQGGDVTVREELIDRLAVKSQVRVANILRLSELGQLGERRTLHLFKVVVGVLAFLICVISYWSYLISRSITTSFRSLGRGTEIIANGNLDYKIETNTHDEFGDLAALFNTMSMKMKALYSTLDQKIQQRTQYLQDANRAARNVLEDLNAEKSKVEVARAKEQAILHSIGEGQLATDEKGNISLINKVAEEMLGMKNEEVVGKLFSGVLALEDEKKSPVAADKRPLRRALATGATTVTTANPAYYYVRKDKTRFPVAIVATPIMLDKKVIGAIEVFRDITKEKEIDRAKTEFVSLASHQLRTPLTSVSWYSEMLLADISGALDEKQRTYLNEVSKGNERMVVLVDALLNVSRLELGTLTIDPKPTDIVRLIQSEIDEQRMQIDAKSIYLSFMPAGDIPLIQVDQNLFTMVIQNLLSNAVKYTPERGGIAISIVVVPAEDGGQDILMKMSDTGYGIPKDQQSKIFTKLFRADNVRKQDTEGTGLGLYVAKSIIESFGGKIWFESKENQGTTFFVAMSIMGMKKKKGTTELAMRTKNKRA